MARNRKGKLFTLFESKYNINFYYKPSFIDDDIFYIIILDNKVLLKIRVYENIVLVINSIQQLTDSYLANFYKELVSFLVEQTMFTVMIPKHTATNPLWQYCRELPVVEDMRFIQLSAAAYNRISDYYNKTVEKYGMILVAITDDYAKVQEPKKKEIRVIDTPEQHHVDELPKDPDITLVSQVMVQFKDFIKARIPTSILKQGIDNGEYILNIDNIELFLTVIDNSLHIIDVSKGDISSIYYMPVFETLEDFLEYCPIYVDNITNQAVYNICNIREYDKVSDVIKSKRNSLGTYKIKKYIRR